MNPSTSSGPYGPATDSVTAALVWLKSLFAAFISGGATALTAWGGMTMAQVAGADVPNLNWKAIGIIFLSAGIFNAAAYLKKSPLPGITNDAP